MNRPDFLVIGASRSGTTWLHDNLQTHPQIYIPGEPGEMHFFTKYYDKGLDFYLSHFDKADAGQVSGEVTPTYLYSPEAAKRIHDHLPDIRLILALRNPVERLYSLYWILRDKYGDNGGLSFEEKIEKEPHLIRQGFYIDNLAPYLEKFDPSRFLFLFFDEMIADSAAYLRSVYTFLGVDEHFESPFLRERINRSGFLKHGSRFPQLFYAWRLFKKLKLNRLAYRIERFNSGGTREMDPATRKRLIDIYRPKNEALGKLIGINLDHWNSP